MSSAIITAEVREGASIQRVAEDMHDLCAQVCCNVKFTYEGIEMVINEYQLPEMIVKEWERLKVQKKKNEDFKKHLYKM